ncbi:C25 family cysteine peptidase [Candidatus Riflebacteria bacterium]
MIQFKKVFILVSVLFLSTVCSHAAWNSIERGGKKVDFTVLLGKNASQIVSVSVPGYDLKTQVVDGKTYSVVSVPEFPGLTEKGAPDLPRIAGNFLIPDQKAPNLKIVRDDYVDIKLTHPILSSKGHFTRNIRPDTVPYTFSKVYKKDAFYPEKIMAEVSSPFIIHNVNGINIHFNLFQYNPVKKVLRIHKTLAISITNAFKFMKSTEEIKVPAFVDDVLARGFVNYEKMKAPLRLKRVTESGRMLVICHDAFVDAAMPWVVWKKKAGIPTKLVKMSAVGSTAADVMAFVKAEFAKGNLSYLHLIGDAEHVPTLRGTVESAHSDQSYGLLAGNDWYLDIIVSRFSAKEAKDVAYQAAKTITYEAYPDTGSDGAWYRKGIGIGSNEGNPKDWEYADDLRDALLAYTYKKIDRIYDPGASKAAVAAAVNDGRSVINYIGHGSSSMWVTTRFSNADVNNLSNGSKLPYIWSVACVNGAFAGYSDCFAEAWMKAGTVENMRGAVAIAAASTNMQWIPPLHWQAEINIVLLKAGNFKTFGGLSLNGMSKIAEVYGPTSKSFKMFVEQTGNFGDGSVNIRYDLAKKVELKNFNLSSNGLTSVVASSEGARVDGLVVTVYNKKMDLLKSAITDKNGAAKIDFDTEIKGQELYMTVTGTNIQPIVDKKIY